MVWAKNVIPGEAAKAKTTTRRPSAPAAPCARSARRMSHAKVATVGRDLIATGWGVPRRRGSPTCALEWDFGAAGRMDPHPGL